MSLDCALFEHRNDFASYVYLIEYETGGNISLAAQCSPQICQVIWGTGNPDITGIGMIIGYIIENMLGFLLAVLCIVATSGRGNLISRNADLVFRIFDSFFEYALFYAFSTELACAVMVTKVTFGLNADGMGNLTLRMTWAAAALTILPLAYRMLIYDGKYQPEYHPGVPGTSASLLRRKLTFPLYCVCWIISLYIFLDKMADTFGPSEIGQVGSDSGAVIDPYTWAEIEALCTGDWNSLTPMENMAIDAFDIAASLLVSLMTFTKLLTAALSSCGVKLPVLFQLRLTSGMPWRILSGLLMILLPFLAVGLTWSIFRLANLQDQLADAIGEVDTDSQWTFGQIVSVTVFTPVLVELLCEILSRWSARGSPGV